jgi:membrane associated rhomboid family serine protease
MILPIQTSIEQRKTPYANYALIVLNVLIFFFEFTTDPRTGQTVLTQWAHNFMLKPNNLEVSQFITYAFLHGGFMHLFGNMFFLYLFGNNVNEKLGNINYICFYLAGGIASGFGHILLNSSPVLGASGAVAAVTGAYLVLFPRSLITVIYWFIIIGTLEVPALYFIAFKLIFIDNVMARTSQGVAYDAHLAGYAFGIASVLALIGTKIIPSADFDLYSTLKQWNRRRKFKSAVSQGYDPFSGTKKVKSKEVKTPAQKRKAGKINELRRQISTRINQHNISAAADLYLELIDIDEKQVPPKQYLLDIANQLASENRHSQAADAYEKFLKYYKNYEHSDQVQLMVGLIYARYLNNKVAAQKHLGSALEKLSDSSQISLCRKELSKLEN